jgi:hypothetical protein
MNRTISVLSILLLASAIFFCFGAISVADTVSHEMGGMHASCTDSAIGFGGCIATHLAVVFMVTIGSLFLLYFFIIRNTLYKALKDWKLFSMRRYQYSQNTCLLL